MARMNPDEPVSPPVPIEGGPMDGCEVPSGGRAVLYWQRGYKYQLDSAVGATDTLA